MMELGQAASSARFCPVHHPGRAPVAVMAPPVKPANEVTPAHAHHFHFRGGRPVSRGAARRQHLAQREGNLRRRIALYNARGGTQDIRRANALKQELATTERRRGQVEAAYSADMLTVQPSSALSGVGQAEAPQTVRLPLVGPISKAAAVTVGVLGVLAYLGYKGS